MDAFPLPSQIEAGAAMILGYLQQDPERWVLADDVLHGLSLGNLEVKQAGETIFIFSRTDQPSVTPLHLLVVIALVTELSKTNLVALRVQVKDDGTADMALGKEK